MKEKEKEMKNVLKAKWNELDGATKTYILTIGSSGMIGFVIGRVMKATYYYGVEDATK